MIPDTVTERPQEGEVLSVGTKLSRDVREGIARSVDSLANAVRVTLGPSLDDALRQAMKDQPVA